MGQALNPFIKERVYIPDGEAHVFGDRVYLFGSHDKENGDSYCLLDYEFFSAPLSDLSSWTSKGINYRASQDPLSSKTNRPYLFAPDCVQGNDGRYYLYYCLAGEKGNGGYNGPISVAVCSTPDGHYEFYGHVKNPDGSLFSEHVLFDPAVLNDSGTIRLYYGTYYSFSSLGRFFRPITRRIESMIFHRSVQEIKKANDRIMGAYTVILDNDMLTVRSPSKPVIDCYAKSGPFQTKLHIFPKDSHSMSGHGFFEGSSIRKIGDEYYFVYSSMNNHELCYARSKKPDEGFVYSGVLISNGDVGYQGRKEKDRLNYTATNHGCIEPINGQYYVFYHKQTHGSDYSRIACAEKIDLDEKGDFSQAEMTSCGLQDGDLAGKGTYLAIQATYITNGKMPHKNNAHFPSLPQVTSNEKEVYLAHLKKKTRVGYRYFNLKDTQAILLSVRGKGVVRVKTSQGVSPPIFVHSSSFEPLEAPLRGGEHEEIVFEIEKGEIEIQSFELKTHEKEI